MKTAEEIFASGKRRDRGQYCFFDNWGSSHQQIKSLEQLNAPRSIWQAVRNSNPDADRATVARMIHLINETVGYQILEIDQKFVELDRPRRKVGDVWRKALK